MSFTKEKFLRDKEKSIKNLMESGDTDFINVFNFLHKHYHLKYFAGDTPIFYVFEAIYIKRIKLPAWKLAQYCNLSRTALFNYRNKIINDFSICLRENIINEEIALTTEENT